MFVDDIAAVFETLADEDTKECLPLDRGSVGAASAARPTTDEEGE